MKAWVPEAGRASAGAKPWTLRHGADIIASVIGTAAEAIGAVLVLAETAGFTHEALLTIVHQF